MTKFQILFDNGGGILLLTDSYCHSYDRPTWAADDAAKLLEALRGLLNAPDPEEVEDHAPKLRAIMNAHSAIAKATRGAR